MHWVNYLLAIGAILASAGAFWLIDMFLTADYFPSEIPPMGFRDSAEAKWPEDVQ